MRRGTHRDRGSTDDGRVRDRLHQHVHRGGSSRQPTYEEYAQIMTGYTPEQLPVLSAIAKGLKVFDHWFCEVPSQTFMNRSFWTAATSSGFVINSPHAQLDPAQHRRDAVRSPRGAWAHMEGVRTRTDAPVVHRLDPPPACQGPARDELRALLRVRARRGQRHPARLQPDRTEHALRAQRLSPCFRPVVDPPTT